MAKAHIRDPGTSSRARAGGWRDPQAHGFSLTELLMVVLVFSIVAMVTVPMVGASLGESRLSRAAADVVAALDYARSRAMASGADVRVRFPMGTGTVLVERYAPATNLLAGADILPAASVEGGVFKAVRHPLVPHTNAFVDVTQGTDGPTIASADFGGTNVVVFQSLGVPSSTGRVVLLYGKSRRVVTLEGETGRTLVGD